jgi:copper chaperone CopZ
MRSAYKISGMHCESCASKIRGALDGLAEKVEVTFKPPRADLEGKILPSYEELQKAVAGAGDYHIVPYQDGTNDQITEQKTLLQTYTPLFVIIIMLVLVSLKAAMSANEWMLNFMAGFFLVFGAFKLFDLRGFCDAYSTYDLLAKRVYNYGLIYPFLELALGFAFLFRFQLEIALWFSIALMAFSSLGVIQALFEKKKIRCACLGTALNLPMSTITLLEDLGMVIMAGFMLAGF